MYGETSYASDMQLVEFVLCGLLSGIGDIDIPPVDAINSLLAFAIQCDGFFDEALRELIVVVMCRSLAQVVDADCEISPLGGKIFAWLSLLKLRFVCFFFFLFGGSCLGRFEIQLRRHALAHAPAKVLIAEPHLRASSLMRVCPIVRGYN
jgi:hypothetical protein